MSINFFSFSGVSIGMTIIVVVLWLFQPLLTRYSSAGWRHWIWFVAVIGFLFPIHFERPLWQLNVTLPREVRVEKSADSNSFLQKTSIEQEARQELKRSMFGQDSLHVQSDRIIQLSRIPVPPSPNFPITRNNGIEQIPIPNTISNRTSIKSLVSNDGHSVDETTADRKWNLTLDFGRSLTVAMYVWICGCLFVLGWHVLRYIKLIKTVRRWSLPEEDPEILILFETIRGRLGIHRNIPLLRIEIFSSPIMFGFFHPAVVLPDKEIPEDEMALILEHELLHYKRGHLWLRLFCFSATVLHWFNPIVWLAVRKFGYECEQACDEEIVAAADQDRRCLYSEAILGIIRKGGRHGSLFTTGFYKGIHGMKQRIKNIMEPSSGSAGALLFGLTLVLILFGRMLIGISAETQTPSVKTDQTPAVVKSSDQSASNKSELIANDDSVSKARIKNKPGRGTVKSNTNTNKDESASGPTAHVNTGRTAKKSDQSARSNFDLSEFRNWKDDSGRFSIQAVLVEQTEKRVRLRRKDGQEISVSLQKLCQADRDFLKEQADNPFLVKKENPVAEKKSEKTSIKTSEKIEADLPDPSRARSCYIEELNRAFLTGDRSKERTIPSGGNVEWKYQPGKTESIAKTMATVNVPLFTSSELRDNPAFHNQRLTFAEDPGSKAYLSYTAGIMNYARCYLEVCSLKDGRSTLYKFPFHATCCGVSPDGEKILAIRHYKSQSGGFDTKKILTVLEFHDGTLRTVQEFLPCMPSDSTFSTVKRKYRSTIEGNLDDAVWIENDRILTFARTEVILWDLKNARSIWAAKSRKTTVALSPDRKTIAMSTSSGLALYEVSSGDLLGVLPKETAKSDAAAFSPDARRLAVMNPNALTVYDLKTCKAELQIQRTATFSEKPIWTDDNNILANGVLYNLKKKIPLCRYANLSGKDSVTVRHNGSIFLIAGYGKEAQLLSVILPHKSALEQLEKLDTKSDFWLYPGNSVRLELKLNGYADEKTTCDVLTQRLKAKNITVSDSAKIVLTVTYKDTKNEETVSYTQSSGFGPLIPFPGPGITSGKLGTIKLKVFLQKIDISIDGKELWKFQDLTVGPQIVKYDPNKKIEDSVREANLPRPEFIKFAPIPDYISKLDGGSGALLNARIDQNGIQ